MSTNIYIIIATILWGVGAIFTKVASNTLHPLMLALVAELFYIVFVPLGIWFTKTPIQINTTGFIFGFISAACVGSGSLAYYFALQKGDAGAVAAATSVYPVLTLIISAIILNEAFTLKKVIGCILAVVSVILITQK
jgi:bacterial/archaeal transporter family protein